MKILLEKTKVATDSPTIYSFNNLVRGGDGAIFKLHPDTNNEIIYFVVVGNIVLYFHQQEQTLEEADAECWGKSQFVLVNKKVVFNVV